MYGHKYTSKKQRWVSNGNGGQVLKRTYSYNSGDSAFGLFLLGILFASPFLIARKIKEQKRFSNHKPLIERLKEGQQRSLEKLQQTRKSLWNTIKNKRNGESDSHWIKRLKRYGFTTDGTHIKTGINYQINIETEKSKMKVDIKSKLKELEGETFYTVTGKSYTYEFVGENNIKPSRANYTIHLSNFARAVEISPTELRQIREVRGPSYVFGIITDKRFN
ncbi:MAG: hypothetical protein E7363_00030 [Clostridiales bacterium]|nr:hypothetical protein [Clostridiales bacterium]